MPRIEVVALTLLLSACGPLEVVEEPDELGTTDESGLVAAGVRLEVGTVLKATANVNLRSGPAKSYGVLEVVAQGQQVTVVEASTQPWVKVSLGGRLGYSHRDYYDVVSRPGTTSTTLAAIDAAAVGSACARYQWANRGQMPRGFIKGVARDFARAVCNPGRSDLAVASRARTTDTATDALAWYASTFSSLGLSNERAGLDTLRHVYVLLLGLGMRESSGEHCVGRDTSATNTTASSAEAGAWQTSYDSHVLNPQLDALFARFRASTRGCDLPTFSEGVSCSAANWKNWGTGDGVVFQKLEKECPAFAAEYAAVMLRVSGGSRGHYGPLRTKAAEVRPECDSMLQQVQRLVASDPSVCGAL